MDVVERIGKTGLVPVVVFNDINDVVPATKAILAGGVDIMEITLRTDVGIDAIKLVSEQFPDVLVGAGTVLSLDKCKEAVSAGAKFIVSPGYDPDIVEWCVKNGVAITPGCVTPTEITAAIKMGLNVVKFFPQNIYGGVKAMKALTGPFKGIKFIPTGGVNNANLAEYISQPFILAVGGGWLCKIESGKYENITATCKEAVEIRDNNRA